jgi:hypothetical protein
MILPADETGFGGGAFCEKRGNECAVSEYNFRTHLKM